MISSRIRGALISRCVFLQLTGLVCKPGQSFRGVKIKHGDAIMPSQISVDHGLTAEYLRTLFKLDSVGRLWFKRRPVSMFRASATRSTQGVCNIWNAKHAGREVNPGSIRKRTSVTCPDGINRQIYVANIIWCMRYGYWPPKTVDHANGDTLDNSPDNHRLVTITQSVINRGKQRNNKSGVTGVYWYERYQEWWARITVEGEKILLYRGSSFRAAVAARKQAEHKYFGDYRNKRTSQQDG